MGSIVGGLTSALGGVISGNKASKAAAAQAEALRQAGQKAFEASRFRPVGTTTAFGTSNFTVDPTTGALTQAGYQLTPEMQAIQGGLLSQAGGAGMDLTGQGLQGAQSLFGLGQQYLAESPQQAAQNWMQGQQALLAPSREQAWANLNQGNYNQGTTGLKVAQGGNLQAANPYASALANTQAMQDLQLASQAQQAGMDQTRFGAGLFGLGAQAATAGYSPLQSALTGASNIDTLGQQALKLGMGLGETAGAANTRAAQLQLGTAAPAAQAQYTASSWSPWGAALSSLGSSMGGMSFPGGAGGGGGGFTDIGGQGAASNAALAAWGI